MDSVTLFFLVAALVAVLAVGFTAVVLRGFVRVFGAGFFCLCLAIYLLW